MARELVHRLQTMRKQAGFDITDHIETFYQGGDSVKRVMEGYASYISLETLSRSLKEASPPEGAYIKSHLLDGNEVVLAVSRL
jgi:isoleucyl-tRNA synthetase